MGKKNVADRLTEVPLIMWEILTVTPIYFFFSLINLRVKLHLTPAWGDGTLVQNHEMFTQFIGPNHEQSRILQFAIPEILHRLLGLSVEHAYILQRLGFVFLALSCFHFYLRAWFGVSGAFSGAVFLSAIMPLSYMNHLQESSPLLLLTFLIGLWAIREKKNVLLIGTLVVGGLNNETMLILPLAYFLYNYQSSDAKSLNRLAWKTFLISIPLLIIVGSIRYLTRDNPPLGSFWQLPYNIMSIRAGFKSGLMSAILFIFYLFNMFWFYSFVGLKSKPLFMRRVSLIIPIFVTIHLLVARLEETRLMLPLGFLLIPMGLWTIYFAKSDASKPIMRIT